MRTVAVVTVDFTFTRLRIINMLVHVHESDTLPFLFQNARKRKNLLYDSATM